MKHQTLITLKKWSFFLLLFMVFTVKMDAQISKLERANKYYHQKNYVKAIPLFEKVLEKKASNSTRIKLAKSYAKINQHKKANHYYELALKSKRINPNTYLNYATSLVAVGNYEKANEQLFLYSESIQEENDESIALVLACNSSATIPAYFNTGKVSYLSINTKYDENSPIFLGNEIIFSSDRPAGFLKRKLSPSGQKVVQVYRANMKDYKVHKFSAINKGYLNTANASFDSTGTVVYFTQNSVKSNSSNTYPMQLFSAHQIDGHWVNDGVLPFCRNSSNYMHPAISPDGKRLYFVSDIPNGLGGTDIYVVNKTKKGWSKPKNLGSNINTELNEGFPFIDIDNNLYFCSKGHKGFGGFDVFVSRTSDLKEFAKATNLGKPINSYGDDISFSLSKDKKKGLFSSSRNDGNDDDIFMVEILE